MNKFNLPSNLIYWLRSYLLDRRQHVKFNNRSSNEFLVNTGVPQGSHLGPTLFLFLLLFNDIVQELGSDVFISLFADDLKIAVAINSIQDTLRLQSAISKLKAWCTANYLHLNLSKCSVMSISNKYSSYVIVGDYHYGDHTFNRVTEQKDLAVMVDSKMNFNNHVNMIVSRAKSTLGFVKRFCYDINNMQTPRALYYALIQSILEYCCVV